VHQYSLRTHGEAFFTLIHIIYGEPSASIRSCPFYQSSRVTYITMELRVISVVRLVVDFTDSIEFAAVCFAELSVAEKAGFYSSWCFTVCVLLGISGSHALADEAWEGTIWCCHLRGRRSYRQCRCLRGGLGHGWCRYFRGRMRDG
jgi:hypothetical protein